MYTIEDISKMTGLSISIISRYLNGHNVRKENKILIDDAVNRTGYTPNEFARNLRAGQTKSIGVIVPNLMDNFALSVINYAEIELKKKGYSIFISDYNLNTEINNVKAMIKKRVDAVIMLPINDNEEISDLLRNNNIPLIIFDQYFEHIVADYVLFENKEAVKSACDVLIKANHKDIAIILGPLSDYTQRQRFKGFKKSLDASGISVKEEFILHSKDYTMQSSYETVKDFIQKGNKPTAFITSTFDLTLGAIKAFNELNISIPSDISLMAFDSLPVYEVISPKLWTIVQPVQKIGQELAKMVIKRIGESDDLPPSTVFIDYEIKQGDSIKKIDN